MHTNRILDLSDALPVMIVVVDMAERVQAFLPELTELLDGSGLVAIDTVMVVDSAVSPT